MLYLERLDATDQQPRHTLPIPHETLAGIKEMLRYRITTSQGQRTVHKPRDARCKDAAAEEPAEGVHFARVEGHHSACKRHTHSSRYVLMPVWPRLAGGGRNTEHGAHG